MRPISCPHSLRNGSGRIRTYGPALADHLFSKQAHSSALPRFPTEGQGFEPWERLPPPNGFQNRRIRPLCQPSIPVTGSVSPQGPCYVTLIAKLTEAGGFEPPIRLTPYTRFPSVRDKPLCHASMPRVDSLQETRPVPENWWQARSGNPAHTRRSRCSFQARDTARLHLALGGVRSPKRVQEPPTI